MKKILIIINLQILHLCLIAQTPCDSLQILPANFPQNINICNNDSVELEVNLSNCNYLWSTGEFTQSIMVSPTQSESFYVKVYDGSTYCDQQVQINPIELVTPPINGNTVVSLNSVETYYVNQNVNSSYYWELPAGGSIINNYNNSIDVYWANVAGVFNLSVIETDSFGCIGSIETINISIGSTTSLIESSTKNDVSIIKTYDILGNEISENSLNSIKIHLYSDGTFKKIFSIKP